MYDNQLFENSTKFREVAFPKESGQAVPRNDARGITPTGFGIGLIQYPLFEKKRGVCCVPHFAMSFSAALVRSKLFTYHDRNAIRLHLI